MKIITSILSIVVLFSISGTALSQTPRSNEITNIANAYAQLFDDHGWVDRMLTVRQSSGRIPDFKKVRSDDGERDFGDKVTSARWHIPQGWALILYEHHNFKGRQFPLIGTGFFEEDYRLFDFSDKCSSAAWKEVGYNFTFSTKISARHRQVLLQQHRLAYKSIVDCKSLGEAQKRRLLHKYWRPIAHDITTDRKINGSAWVNGSRILVNTNNLLPVWPPLPDHLEETAQTLIHEMMHCAGYVHPEERASQDIPMKPGPYYSTPVLQAEICIAGDQSRQDLGRFLLRHECVPGSRGRFDVKGRH